VASADAVPVVASVGKSSTSRADIGKNRTNGEQEGSWGAQSMRRNAVSEQPFLESAGAMP